MKALTMILAGAALLFNAAATASDNDDEQRYQHFKPEASENLEQAIMNLTKYNAKLQEIIEGDMPAEDMVKVHELTYTLEVLDVAANSLEEVHLGSEAMNKQRVKGFGKSYLDTLNHVLGEHSKHHEGEHKEHH